MEYIIKSPEGMWQADVKLPASKSISNRALILNALSYSPFPIQNLSDCDDTNVLVRALESNDRDFDIQAAGTAMRFLTAFLAKIVGEWTITGTERMKNRPIRALVDALNSLGAHIEYIEKEGFPPLRIFGSALQGGEISLAGNVSSQYISALLMIAPTMENGLVLHLTGDVISKPYIQLTLQLMKQFGVEAEWQGESTLRVAPQSYRPVPFTVEADWSAASYWFEMMALSRSAHIRLQGLFKHSFQGDAMGARLFSQLGVGYDFGEGLTLRRTGQITRKLVHNFVNEPDLAQTFAVTCALLNVPFYFNGLQTLRIKETDRIAALKTELKKLGYVLKDPSEGVLMWDGERCESETNPIINTYEDHRMALAFAPVALVRKEGIRIANPHVVSKSYPHFWEHLLAAGFSVES